MATSLLVIMVAGVYQLIARLETSQPGMQVLSYGLYNSLMSLHGIMMLAAAVYIFVLPGLGVISEVLPVFSRKPLFGYKAVALSSLGISIGGTMVWGHHMFAAGMEEWMRVPFMFTTLLVAVPTGVKIFSWLATMWLGRIHLDTPMLFALTAIAAFLIGGITGVPNGIIPVNLFIHDTYWVVAHFHSTLFGGFIFPAMAALYFWFPKITGRLMSERLGKTH